MQLLPLFQKLDTLEHIIEQCVLLIETSANIRELRKDIVPIKKSYKEYIKERDNL